MPDNATLAAYDSAAAAFAADWHEQPAPADLHAIVRQFFQPGLTADIGCGSGREAGWLSVNGFPVVGYDASTALLEQARARYPNLAFEVAQLPDLSGIRAESFTNVLCETVIMHLPQAQIAPAVSRLMFILKSGSILYVSWRVTTGTDHRDAHGRLYTAFGKDLVLGALSDATILLDEEAVSASSGKIVHRIVARKSC